MERERSALDSFTEPIDLNQGSISGNTSTMDHHSSSWDNMLSPVQNRLSDYMLGSTGGNLSTTNASNDTCHNFARLDRGKSSSSANTTQDGDDSKANLVWPSSFYSCSGPDPTSENWSFNPPSGIGASRPSSTQSYCSNHAVALNLNSNNGPQSLYKSGHSEIDQIPTFYASSSNLKAFSGSPSTFGENTGASGSSFAVCGSSCKRKAFEGTSGQLYPPGGSSSSNQPMDKNVIQHLFPDCYASQGNLSIASLGPLNLSPNNYSEQINPSTGVGISRQTPGFFPSSSVGLSESPTINLTSRLNHGRHDSVLFDTAPRSTSLRSFGVYTSESRSPMTIATNRNSALNQPDAMQINEGQGGMHPYTWNEPFGSRCGSSFGASEEVVNVRASRRNNNLETHLNISPSETRNPLRDQIDWSFVPGNLLSSRNHHSASRVGPGSSGGRASLAAWLPHQNPTTSQDHQRLSDIAPWIPSHRGESDSGFRRSHFAHLPSSADDAGPSSRVPHHMPGEDTNRRRSLAAIEGRHRLIRHMLAAMRRGVHLQAEDYMLVDPFMNGFAELHDTHRDMRLDVDNMSYEELLALEERIGSVNTGLSEERIRVSMKQWIFETPGFFLSNSEPCCICQGELHQWRLYRNIGLRARVSHRMHQTVAYPQEPVSYL
ncbi:hypothetical protein OROHE_019214 [Orobanche hederae]